MHSFGLLIGDVLAHDWAKHLVGSAQRIVSYFQASTLLLAKLRDVTKALNIQVGGLVSSNKTRFTSVHLVRVQIFHIARRYSSSSAASVAAWQCGSVAAWQRGSMAATSVANMCVLPRCTQCLESVKRLEAPLRQVAATPDIIRSSEVIDIINDASFWRTLQLLCDLLEPASKVVMAIQADGALLADVPRYWAYMARVIETKLEPLLSVPGL